MTLASRRVNVSELLAKRQSSGVIITARFLSLPFDSIGHLFYFTNHEMEIHLFEGKPNSLAEQMLVGVTIER